MKNRVSSIHSRAGWLGGAGIVTGFVAWPNNPVFATALLVLWLSAPTNRREAFVLAAGYYLASTRGLQHGAGVFFGSQNILYGTGLWVGASLLLAIPYALLWEPFAGPVRNWLRLAALCTWLTLPFLGFGLFSFVPPFIAAGSWFPTTGFVGIILILLLSDALASLAYSASITRFRVLSCAALLLLAVFLNVMHPEIHGEPRTKGVNTDIGRIPEGMMARYAWIEHLSQLSKHDAQRFRVTLFPETVAGEWYAGTAFMFNTTKDITAHTDHVFFMGAEEPLPGVRLPYRDALVKIAHGKESYLPDSIPVPFGMWHPWHSNREARMDLFRPEVTTINGHLAGYFICYESLLPWPAMQIMAAGQPDTLLFAANDWWAQGTSIPAIQRAAAQQWAYLMGAQLLTAVNA
jgi:hypothetical protein